MPRGIPQPFELGPFSFSTQTEAIDFVSEMLRTLPQRVALSDPSDSVLRDLFLRHPRHAEKLKGEISHFTIDAALPKGFCFHLHRIDGSRTDFSFRKCLQGERHEDLVAGALRNGINDQIQAFRNAAFRKPPVCCQITMEPVSITTCHIDHQPPATFYAIMRDWLAKSGLDISQIKISESKDNQSGRVMTDEDQMRQWSEFHKQHATLRVTSVRGNLSLSKLQLSNKLPQTIK